MTIYQALTVLFPSVAAGTDDDLEFPWPFEGTWSIEEARIAPATAAAANGTNYVTVSLEANDGAGGAYTTLASLDTSSVAFAVGTTRTMTNATTVAAVAARNAITQGDSLRIGKTDSGTGALFHGGVSVLARRVE